MAILLVCLGLAILTAGAEVLVRGATGLARAIGLPSLIIGLTVVAYGTSAPELAVSVKSSFGGQADIALGNVLGSNTFNILFILGLSALIKPLKASAQLVRLDVPVMIGVSVLAWLMAANGTIGRAEGIILCLGAIAYTTLLVYLGKRRPRPQTPDDSSATSAAVNPQRLWISIGQVMVGFGLLVLGARWLVDGAVDLSRMFGVSELMIGCTIIAAGTSLPELATSVVACLRGERDLAVGNVVGSNIFNILAVMGAGAAVSPAGLAVAPEALRFDIPVAVAVAGACLPIFFTGGRISRGEGALFLVYYGAYITFLVLAATKHPALPSFTAAVIWFVIPLSALGVAFSVMHWMANKRMKDRNLV
ncbi:MAG: calcium/sodium antiporter [Phycisphaerales bacterium]|nr:calcium/sodium antiporter [Phycisphaerales bacterium]